MNDGDEVTVTNTDPNKADTDDNGVNDGDEDPDEDGLSNSEEVNVHGTNTTNPVCILPMIIPTHIISRTESFSSFQLFFNSTSAGNGRGHFE